MFKKKGFTLIELLVVVLIVGILAALVIVNVNDSRKFARDAKRMANIRAIQAALEQYNEDNKGYPPTTISNGAVYWQGYGDNCNNVSQPQQPQLQYFKKVNPGGTNNLTSRIPEVKNTTSGDNGWIPGLAPKYIQVLPIDPGKLGEQKCYLYMSDGTDYILMAWGGMESICDNDGNKPDPGDTCNPVSIQEMDIPSMEEGSIGVWTSGITPAKDLTPPSSSKWGSYP